MFLNWKRPNNHALTTHKTGRIELLRPGWNEFPEEVWKENEGSAEVQKLIKDGVIEISSVKVMAKQGKKTVARVDLSKGDQEVHLTDLADEDECCKIAGETYNRDLLTRWSDEETRSKVKRAITKQLKTLTTQPAKEE